MLETELRNAKRMLELVQNARAERAKMAHPATAHLPKDRWYALQAPDGREIRCRHSSAQNLAVDLIPGYRLVGEIFGCDEMVAAEHPLRRAPHWSSFWNQKAPCLLRGRREMCYEDTRSIFRTSNRRRRYKFCEPVAVGKVENPLSAREWHDVIAIQAAANFPEFSAEQAFSRYLDLPVGKALFRVSKMASAEVVKAATTQADCIAKMADLDGDEYLQKRSELDGPNHAKLHSMAVQMTREKAGMSYQRAFTNVFTDPKNSKLAAGAKDEQLARQLASVHGALPDRSDYDQGSKEVAGPVP